MSEKEPFSVSASPELIERVDSVADNRSEAVEEALESYLRATSSGEQRLDEIDSEIAEIEEERKELEQKKQMLEVEREQIEDELERQEEEREVFEELVDELAEQKSDGYSVLDSTKFKRAVSLSEWTGELAVEKVLNEVRDRAGIDEQEQDTTEVVTETADDYDFDLSGDDE